MKTIAIIILMFNTALLATAADTTNVTATIKGKRVEFGSGLAAQIAQRSVDLLASCAYMDPKPRWGATSTEPESIAGAEKQPHLHLAFSSPQKVEIPVEKVTIQPRDIIITLPLTTAGIWVRTDNGVMYFAMFDHTAAEHLQKLLDETQKP